MTGTITKWLGGAVTLAGLVIGATTAYYSVIRQTEELRVVLDGDILLEANLDKSGLNLYERLNIVFANTGDVPFSISRVAVEISDHGFKCRGDVIDSNIKPFVIEAKKVIRKDMEFYPDPERTKAKREANGTVSVPEPAALREGREYKANLCLVISGTSATQGALRGEIELIQLSEKKDGDGAVSIVFGSEPTILWHKPGLIFWK